LGRELIGKKEEANLFFLTVSEKERWKLLGLGPSFYKIPYIKYTGQKKG
jgi:hypothetical protein